MRVYRIIFFCVLFSMMAVVCSTPDLSANPPKQADIPESITSEKDYSEPELRVISECWIQDNNAIYGEFLENKSCTALARLLTNAPGYGTDPTNNKSYGGLEYINIQQEKGIAYSLLVDGKESVKPCDNLVLFRKGDDPIGHTAVVFSVDLKNDILYYLDQNYDDMGITLRPLKISAEGKYAYIIPSTCRKKIDYEKCSPIINNQTVDVESSSLDVDSLSNKQTISITGWKLFYDPNEWQPYKEVLPDNPLCPWKDCSNSLTSLSEGDCVLRASLSEGYLDTHKLVESTKDLSGKNVQIITTFDTNTNKIIHVRYFNPDNYPDSCIGTLWGVVEISDSCIDKIEFLISESLMRIPVKTATDSD